jgi:hypothetical protein
MIKPMRNDIVKRMNYREFLMAVKIRELIKFANKIEKEIKKKNNSLFIRAEKIEFHSPITKKTKKHFLSLTNEKS